MDDAGAEGPFRELVAALPHGVWLFGPEGELLSENRAGKALGLDARTLRASHGASLRMTDSAGELRTLDVHRLVLSENRSAIVVTDTSTLLGLEELRAAVARRAEAFGDVAVELFGELRNLFAPVSIATEYLAKKLVGTGTAGLVAGDAHAAAALASKLLRHSLDYVHQVPPTDEPFAPSKVIAEMRRLLEVLTGERVPLEVELGAASDATVRVDRIALERVLLNLVCHARDAVAPQGQISVTADSVSMDEAEAREAVCPGPGEYVVIKVSDRAPSRAHERPLSQAVYRLIRERRWGMSVTNGTSGGTTVAVYLPRHRAAAPKRPQP